MPGTPVVGREGGMPGTPVVGREACLVHTRAVHGKHAWYTPGRHMRRIEPSQDLRDT